MKIAKGSRHSKIIGDFGERLVCNWLSRSGFEVAVIDHTGLDVVAYDPTTKKRLGITVKSRTRVRGKESEAVNLFSYRKGKNDRDKLNKGCEAFHCEPWIAVYVETEYGADLYLTSLEHYDCTYRTRDRAIDDWKMGESYRDKYRRDQSVRHVHVKFDDLHWGRESAA